ncbi:thiamine ABC transporter substrate-binding protein [Halostella sp. JP-L12]|uniref:thiamine ABC transporter substrate-binding protein n=1 Tax=Halostella TaxID=1843185 RepID=UPI000EF81C82|nr:MULTISPECIES: thiamine ABC transporter substrate-binding protein [Halostella]NHN46206.1 thiamine ABC transporter substrate-binding protein [Halostella sp. JP-L12]
MRRRTFLTASVGAAGTLLSGCITQDGEGDGNGGGDERTTLTTPESFEGTLTVATYEAFVDAPSSSPGEWVKQAFESEHEDVTLEWQIAENGVNEFIQRSQQDAGIDADVYLGLNVDDLVRADDRLDDSLFMSSDVAEMENRSHVRDDLAFDPQNRAVPYDTGYIALVYDENEVEEPGTFDDLTTDPYEGTLLAQNAQSSDPGRAFMLWTVDQFGEDGYLDYWRALQDNDVRIFDSWSDSYDAYSQGERPMVVSYSTDQVYANQYDQDMSRHQVAFPNGQGYANPEGAAVFADSDAPALGFEFVDFLLSAEAQSEIAVRNVQLPATDHADLPEEFDRYAHEPEEAVVFSYEELQGNVDGWVDDWAREIAGN